MEPNTVPQSLIAVFESDDSISDIMSYGAEFPASRLTEIIGNDAKICALRTTIRHDDDSISQRFAIDLTEEQWSILENAGLTQPKEQ